MGDLFATLSFSDIAAVLGVIAACPQHEFEVPTLKPGSDRLRRSVETRVILPSGEVIGAGYRIGRESSGMAAEDWKERGAAWMSRIGRESAGRLLDGVTHDGEVT